VRREKLCIFSGCNSRPATVVPAGSNRNGDGGNEIVEAFDGKGRLGRSASKQAVICVNTEQASKRVMREPTQPEFGEGRGCGKTERQYLQSRRGSGDGMSAHGDDTKHGKPWR
jgi:hypothetical protein